MPGTIFRSRIIRSVGRIRRQSIFANRALGPITLTVEQDGVTREVQGESVWYLLLAEPELCRQHLLPLLNMLRGDWHVVETAQAIESQMLRIAGEYRPENLRRWNRMVADLASDRFIVRQAAAPPVARRRDNGHSVFTVARSAAARSRASVADRQHRRFSSRRSGRHAGTGSMPIDGQPPALARLAQPAAGEYAPCRSPRAYISHAYAIDSVRSCPRRNRCDRGKSRNCGSSLTSLVPHGDRQRRNARAQADGNA